MWKKMILLLIFVVASRVNADLKSEDMKELNEAEHVEVIGDWVTVDRKEMTRRSGDYFENHVIRLNLGRGHVTDMGLADLLSLTDDVEGRGRLKKMLLPILLALKIKSAIVIPIIMSGIALIATKGLLTGVASLLMSKVMTFKALLQHVHHDHPIPFHGHHRLTHEEHVDHWTREDKEKKPYILYVPAGQRNTVSSRLEEVPTSDWRDPGNWGEENQSVNYGNGEKPAWMESGNWQ